MKLKILIASLVVSMAFVSCKNEEKKESSETQPVAQEPVGSLTFDVKVDIIIPQETDLILYYKDGSNEWFVDDKTVWQTVKGKPGQVQTVVFSLPEGVLPTDMRFDIGRNEFKDLKDVQIQKFAMSFEGRSFEILQDQMTTFFKPNQYIDYNVGTKVYSFKKDEKGNYDPYFEATQELYPELNKVNTGV